MRVLDTAGHRYHARWVWPEPSGMVGRAGRTVRGEHCWCVGVVEYEQPPPSHLVSAVEKLPCTFSGCPGTLAHRPGYRFWCAELLQDLEHAPGERRGIGGGNPPHPPARLPRCCCDRKCHGGFTEPAHPGEHPCSAPHLRPLGQPSAEFGESASLPRTSPGSKPSGTVTGRPPAAKTGGFPVSSPTSGRTRSSRNGAVLATGSAWGASSSLHSAPPARPPAAQGQQQRDRDRRCSEISGIYG